MNSPKIMLLCALLAGAHLQAETIEDIGEGILSGVYDIGCTVEFDGEQYIISNINTSLKGDMKEQQAPEEQYVSFTLSNADTIVDVTTDSRITDRTDYDTVLTYNKNGDPVYKINTKRVLDYRASVHTNERSTKNILKNSIVFAAATIPFAAVISAYIAGIAYCMPPQHFGFTPR